jgi:hypothetical protein
VFDSVIFRAVMMQSGSVSGMMCPHVIPFVRACLLCLSNAFVRFFLFEMLVRTRAAGLEVPVMGVEVHHLLDIIVQCSERERFQSSSCLN